MATMAMMLYKSGCWESALHVWLPRLILTGSTNTTMSIMSGPEHFKLWCDVTLLGMTAQAEFGCV